MTLRFGSLFSGIEAASAAWIPLGWSCAWVAEVDPFACAVLAHHYPQTPNLGDVTKVDWRAVEPVAVVVGGPPCQGFSVAGNRGGLSDPRGNLSLAYVEALDRLDPEWSLTENVPGWLSMADNSFGHFLGRLVGSDGPLVPDAGQRWSNAGVAAGPKRTAAWRILDAQFFGVPQRRRRVFVVASRGAGNWDCASALFPVGESVLGDPAPRREAGQRIARPTASRPAGGSGYRNDADTADSLITFDHQVAGSAGKQHAVAYGIRSDAARSGEARTPSPDAEGRVRLRDPGFNVSEGIAPTLDSGAAHAVAFNNTGQGWWNDAEVATGLRDMSAGSGSKEATLIATPLLIDGHANNPIDENLLVPHTLRADGFDASQDGTGRGAPLVAVDLRNGTTDAVAMSLQSGGMGEERGVCPNAVPHVLAVDWKNSAGGPNSEDVFMTLGVERTPAVLTLAIRGRGDSHDLEYRDDGIANITGGGPAVAFTASEQSNGYAWERPVYPTLQAHPPHDGSNIQQGVRQGMSVRRLTPKECCRLQGFPDDWLDVTYRNKPAADGNKYKALGNSMAVPVIKWLGQQIQRVEAGKRKLAAD